MSKRLLLLFVAFSLSLHLSGCTSGSSKDETETAQANDSTFAQEGEGDFANDSSKPSTETQPAEPPADAPPPDAANATAPANPDDELSLDEPGALPDKVADKAPEATPPADGSAATPPPTDDALFSNEPPPSTDVATAPPPAAESTPAPEATPVPDVVPMAEEPKPAPPPVAYAPLQKVKDSAFTKKGANLNRVYIGRPGDKVKTVSEKLYGTKDRAKDLVAWNPILKRGVKTGDKIYYSSPSNPTDGRMLTYYEDIGAPPQTYISKDGDNIRTVSKTLLGFKDAWKEVYETNMNVQSRGNIAGGVELKYWPGDTAAPPVAPIAAAPAPAPTDLPPADLPPPQDNNNNTAGLNPPPPPPDQMNPPPVQPPPGQEAMNPPPPPGNPPGGNPPGGAAGTVGAIPPPPPDQNAPPPPPPAVPPVAKAPPIKKKAVTEEAAAYDPDTMMAIGFGGILLIAAAILFVVIRKNRAKRMDLGQTQV